MPVAWGTNKPGMQAGEEVPADVKSRAISEWLYARDDAVDSARRLADAGLHKQICNRLLEPFGHISVVVTATEWDNFFALRCHPDADPTMRALAEAMRDAIAELPRTLALCPTKLSGRNGPWLARRGAPACPT
jgi:thymidylate synthase ThyX